MDLFLSSKRDRHFLEGNPRQLIVGSESGINPVLEICFSHRLNRILLYSENLPKEFFDLSSGMAGVVLQTLRNYKMLLAVVLAPSVEMSSRFHEVMAEENLRGECGFFTDREAAVEWLCNA